MDKMRALLEQEEEKNKNKGSENRGSQALGDGPVYPHWLIPVDSTCMFRFLPDGNDANPFFWVERSIRKIPFTAVKGVDMGKRQQVEVQVPDLNAFERNIDPIQKIIGPWWDEGRKEEYRTYKKRISYIYQGFVRSHPGFVDGKGNKLEDVFPENPIRRFILSPKIHETSKAIIMNPKVKHSPVDFENGRDFEIVMRKQGEFNNYDSSQWSFEEDALTVEELEAIEKFGLEDLNQFLPNRPDAAGIAAIEEIFEASLAGLPYDPDKWADHYRPNIALGGEGAKSDKTTVTVNKGDTSAEVENEGVVKALEASKEDATTPPWEEEKAEVKVEEKAEEKPETKTEKKTSSTDDLMAKLKKLKEEKAAKAS